MAAPQQSVDPWRFMALVADCAQQAGIDIQRAIMFMSAMTKATTQAQAGAKSTAPPMPSSSTTPQ